MAQKTVCDGCGEVSASTEAIGIFKANDYCQKCAVVVNGFVHDRDVLHEKVAEEFNSGVKKLKDDIEKLFPKMSLPDD